MTLLVGKWTPYAMDLAVQYLASLVGGSVGPAPTNLEIALFSDSADPADTNTELTDAGYTRQNSVVFGGGSGYFVIGYTAYGPFIVTQTIAGLAIFDSGTAQCLWFANFLVPISAVAGSGISIPYGDLLVGLENPT